MDQIKKVHVFYFSGTGNARRIATWLSEFAAEKGIDSQLTDISKSDADSLKVLSSDTLIVIISPVHGFNYPKITLDFIRRFPQGDNSLVLMNTRAGMRIGHFVTPGLTGIGFMLSSIILKSKGYKIKGQIPFDMPSNWLSLHPTLSDRSIRILHQKNYMYTNKHCDVILSGRSDFASSKDIIQDLLITPVALAYYLVGRFALAKSFYASFDCDNCGLCIKQCPVKAIKKSDGRPYWSFKCESCMKCMNECPKRAIETAHGLIIVVSLTTAFLTSFITDYFHGSVSIKWIASTFIFMLTLFILYRLQHLVIGNKWINKIITYISFTHYKFWGRYKSIPDSKWKSQ